jgi:hypothetical protein
MFTSFTIFMETMQCSKGSWPGATPIRNKGPVMRIPARDCISMVVASHKELGYGRRKAPARRPSWIRCATAEGDDSSSPLAHTRQTKHKNPHTFSESDCYDGSHCRRNSNEISIPVSLGLYSEESQGESAICPARDHLLRSSVHLLLRLVSPLFIHDGGLHLIFRVQGI